MTATEASNFVGAGSAPESAFTAGAEFFILGDLSSVRIEGVAVKGEMRMKRQVVVGDGGSSGRVNTAGSVASSGRAVARAAASIGSHLARFLGTTATATLDPGAVLIRCGGKAGGVGW